MHDSQTDIGLCVLCRHHTLVVSKKGSKFHFCKKSTTDPSFPKYPRLPMKNCKGYQTAKNAKEREE